MRREGEEPTKIKQPATISQNLDMPDESLANHNCGLTSHQEPRPGIQAARHGVCADPKKQVVARKVTCSWDADGNN